MSLNLDSKPKFPVFNSTGSLLQGAPEFGRAEYSEIAKKCDRAECSLYCRVDSRGMLILGRRFLVRAAGGREERVSVLAEFAGDPARAFEIFYDEARSAVENLDDLSYQVVGIWEAGDLTDHAASPAVSASYLDPTPLSTRGAPERSPREPAGALVPLCAGKLIANEGVTIRPPTIGVGLALIRDVFLGIRTKCRLKIPFSCALARYHPETDLWLTADENGPQRGSGSGDGIHDREYFQALYRYLESNPAIGTTDRGGLAREAKSKFFGSVGASRIITLFPSRHDALFGLYLHDPAALEKLLQGFPSDLPLRLSGETSLAVIRGLVSAGGRRNASGLDWLYPAGPVGRYAPELIKRLSGDNKYLAWGILIENGYFIESVVDDLVQDILNYGNEKGIALLSLMTFANNEERESFTAITRKKVDEMRFDEAVARIKAFLRWDGKRSEAMKVVFTALCNQADWRGDLYRALTRAERAETLNWTNKKVQKKLSHYRRRRLRILLLGILALSVAATALVFFILPLVGIDLAGNIIQVFSSLGDMVSGATSGAEGTSDSAALSQLTEMEVNE